MNIAQGGQIGAYQVVSQLGAGGMGEVFLARDVRLDRAVAIKALPSHLAQDPDRLARFQREAKVLASLNHPGIGAIYGLEEAGGHQYLILEYVEGETLAHTLERGAVAVDEALGVARQIAEALEAAHEKGVVHRDLKPGNVMVNHEGVVKVLDFGLARTGDGLPSSSGAIPTPDSPTVASPAVVHSPTIPGAIMGTAGYMSPEQARGKSVDKRSDIFSFGCVLYEMLTGVQPFAGESVTDSIGAILHREPEWSHLPVQTPPRIRDLLSSCLVKDRRQRLHDIGDARLQLERSIAGREWTSAAGHAHPRKRLMFVSMGAVAAVALLGIGWMLATKLAAPAQREQAVAKLLIPSRTSAYFWASSPAISPDGRFVTFSARPVGAGAGEACLWVRPIDSFDARPLAETTGADGCFWSPDSRFIGFLAESKLWSVDVVQGSSRRLIAAEPGHMGVSWGPDGTLLIARGIFGGDGNGGLVRMPAGGGKAEPVTTIDAKLFEKVHFAPQFLPDGKHFLYAAIDRRPDQDVNVGHLYAGRLGSSERTFIADMTSAAWYANPGWLVYVEDGTIKAAPFDATSLRITGQAVTISDDSSYFRPIGYSPLTVASDGAMVFVPPPDDHQLVWFDATGARLGTIGSKGSLSSPRISPDGTRVVAEVSDRRTGLSDLWIFGVDRPTATHLTTNASWEGAPVWSQDGSIIYFSSDKRDLVDIYSIRADGSGDMRLVYGSDSGGRIWFSQCASPDGKFLMITGAVDKLDAELRVLPLDGSSAAVPFRSTPAAESSGRLSPDGHWVAYVSSESSKSEVYIAPYPGPGPKVQVSEGGYSPVWSPAGDRLYYIQAKGGANAGSVPSRIMAVDLDQPAAFTSPPAPRVLLENAEDIGSFDVAPDGKRFLVELAPVEPPPMRVILNALPPRGGESAARKR